MNIHNHINGWVREMRWVMKFVFILVLIATMPALSSRATPENGIETALRRSIASQPEPDLSVRYRDMNSFSGGTVIELRSDGFFRRWDTKGMQENFLALENDGKVEISRLRPLLELLIEVEAWRQLTPERHAVPDESQAKVSITSGTHRSVVWEWYNEMRANNRIVRIREVMEALVPQGVRRCVLPSPPRPPSVPQIIETCNGPD
jgi:hypothetical protein